MRQRVHDLVGARELTPPARPRCRRDIPASRQARCVPMSLASTWSVAIFGVDGVPVEIEADLAGGVPGFRLLGLPDAALRESKDRVRAAVRNSGEKWPQRQVSVALSPADLPKMGSGYDVALACCVLAASGEIPAERLHRLVLIGELALDGRLRAIRGVLPALLAARRAGLRKAVVPAESLAEAALVDGVEVLGATKLAEILAWLRSSEATLIEPSPSTAPPAPAVADLRDVVGQSDARWALEVAAAGGHHVLLSGPPGAGKTMLAQRLVGLLPALSTDQSLEVTAVHSVAGELSVDAPLVTSPPFVAPHHTTSVAALVGGGAGLAKPGAVSRAHHGILFLDEAAEFAPHLLDALRTALEEGEVRHARRDGIVRYPARFLLVLATNPCPCAPAREVDCICPPNARRRYFSRLSGPLLDRIDLRVRMRPLTAIGGFTDEPPESTATVRARVDEARARAARRWQSFGWRTNAEVPGPALRREYPLPRQALALLDRGLATGSVTARGADRCLRISWTLCDLAGRTRPDMDDVAAALQFRDRSAA
jgi:magnesium chelatase family protein